MKNKLNDSFYTAKCPSDEMFNHSSKDKVFTTLGVKRGYKQAPLPEADCSACPIGKAHRKGLSHKTNMVFETMDVKDGFTESAPLSTVGQTLTVKDSEAKVYATGEDSDDELPEIASDSDFEDEASTNNEAEDIDEEELDFNPATAGRDHGFQKVPCFDLENLRPFKVM